MIKNRWIETESEREQEAAAESVHQLLTAPPHAKRWQNRRWDTSASFRYQQCVQMQEWVREEKDANLLCMLSRSIAVLQLFRGSLS
jgi:hypothetical protein